MEKELINDFVRNGYEVVFTRPEKGKVKIECMPVGTGFGSSLVIDENANFCDALKALYINIFYETV